MKRKYIPSWLNACGIAGCLSRRWTSRLKRYGGMMMIQAIRERQAECFAKLIAKAPSAERLANLRTWAEWMDGNPLRVLPDDIEEYLGFHKLEQPETAP